MNATKSPAPSFQRRDNAGTVQNYAISQSCHKSAALTSDDSVTKLAEQACDALVGNTTAPLVVNNLQIWNSAQQQDSKGLAEYIRFGVKLLYPTSIVSNSLCEDAMNMFNTDCQHGNGVSNGGELTVGEVVTFSADRKCCLLEPSSKQKGKEHNSMMRAAVIIQWNLFRNRSGLVWRVCWDAIYTRFIFSISNPMEGY